MFLSAPKKRLNLNVLNYQLETMLIGVGDRTENEAEGSIWTMSTTRMSRSSVQGKYQCLTVSCEPSPPHSVPLMRAAAAVVAESIRDINCS